MTPRDRMFQAALKQMFRAALKQAGLPMPVTEYRFAVPRRWRFDYAWVVDMEDEDDAILADVAVEVEGGAWTRGRHTRGKGYIADMEKYNEAQLLGWTVLRVTPQQLCSKQTMDWIRRALAR